MNVERGPTDFCWAGQTFQRVVENWDCIYPISVARSKPALPCTLNVCPAAEDFLAPTKPVACHGRGWARAATNVAFAHFYLIIHTSFSPTPFPDAETIMHQPSLTHSRSAKARPVTGHGHYYLNGCQSRNPTHPIHKPRGAPYAAFPWLSCHPRAAHPFNSAGRSPDQASPHTHLGSHRTT